MEREHEKKTLARGGGWLPGKLMRLSALSKTAERWWLAQARDGQSSPSAPCEELTEGFPGVEGHQGLVDFLFRL